MKRSLMKLHVTYGALHRHQQKWTADQEDPPAISMLTLTARKYSVQRIRTDKQRQNSSRS